MRYCSRDLPSKTFFVACVLAIAIVVAAYSNSFENTFHFDDSHIVVSNLFIRSLKNIPRFFTDASTYSTSPGNAQYRPLVATTFAIDYWLGGGLNPPQFHRTQLALLLLLGVAAFFMFLKLMNLAAEHWWNRWVALLAATLYIVHTTATETLNIMHVRTELLSTLGVVGSFVVYLYVPRSRRTHTYLLPMIIGALAKTPAVMFAPIFVVYLALFEQNLSFADALSTRSWPVLRRVIVKALPALIVAGGTFVFVEGMNAPTLNMGGGSRRDYLRTQPFMWLHYGRMFFVPRGLSADTDWTLIPHWYDTRVVAGLIFVVMLLRLGWVVSKTASHRPVAFGIAWFVLALLPASSIFPLAEVTNDHRAFFAYCGFALAVFWGGALLVERSSVKTTPFKRRAILTAAGTLALVAIAGNAVGTYERNKVFLTDESFWGDVVMKSPANGRGLMNYGLSQMARGRFAEAKALFDRATIYTPNYATLEVNLGIVTDRLGQRDVAEAHFQRALQLQPEYPAAHEFYARWLIERGRTAEGAQHLERAIAGAPGAIDARHQLLDAYLALGRTPDAQALAAATLAIAPGDPIATQVLNGQRKVTSARVPSASPDTPDALLETSLNMYKAGDFQGSILAARMALQLKPDSAEAHNNIAAGMASLGRWDEAIAEAREALRLRPDFPLARNNLDWAEREKKKQQQKQ